MVALCFGYLLAHFLLYALVLRRSARMRSEKAIFLFHFVSGLLMAAAAVGYALFETPPTSFGLAGVVLVLSVHGIYSLSFLELWSLAQGGYSLSVLASVKKAQESGSEPDFSGLAQIGKRKLQDRIQGLEKLGLIRIADTKVTLTSRGMIAAVAIEGLLTWLGARNAAIGSGE